MFNPNFVLLYVENPGASAAFYAKLVGHAPVEASPTFALFALGSGLMLGLWSKRTVEPAAQPSFGGSEVAFPVADADAVRALHQAWVALGLPIVQAPPIWTSGTPSSLSIPTVTACACSRRARRKPRAAECRPAQCRLLSTREMHSLSAS